MSIELIPATESDKPFLLNLRKLTMVEHLEKAGLYLSDDEHKFRLDDAYECSYLIIYSGKKVGMIKYRELVDKIEIMQIQIHPNNQGKGLGQMTLEIVLNLSRNKQKKIELSVLKENPVKTLYERLGFSIVGENSHELYMEFNHKSV